MNKQTGGKGITAIFTAALVAALFVGGLGGYAAAKAEGTSAGTQPQTVAIASRWDHEERIVDTSTRRASRWDHEERTAEATVQRASRWDHEER